MQIDTRHFYLWSGRTYAYDGRLPQWWRRSIRIGLGHRPHQAPDCHMVPGYRYRRCIGIDLCLLPNFIWWQDVIRQQVDIIEFQYRIAGIQSWPFARFAYWRN